MTSHSDAGAVTPLVQSPCPICGHPSELLTDDFGPDVIVCPEHGGQMRERAAPDTAAPGEA